MTPSLNRPEPPYLQIVSHIRKQILSGELREGDRVPTGRQIAEDWNVAIATATKVIGTLRAEGLVDAAPGRGTTVSLRAADGLGHSPMDRVRSATKTGRIYPANSYAKIKSTELVVAPARIADALGIAQGAMVIRRHRVTYTDDVPTSTSTSWFDGALADVAPQLLVPERIVGGTMRYIADITGRPLDECIDQLTATTASEQDAEELGVPVGSSLHSVWLTVYDTDGTVVEYGESVVRPGRRVTYSYKAN